MKGSFHIIISNAKLHYDFVIRRNISIIRGDSGTGKSTLVDMVREYYNSPRDSGVNLSCSVPCRVIEGRDWRIALDSINSSIVFIDEENEFLPSDDFATAIRDSDNYYVIVSRESFPNLPYSVDEIYGIRTSGKYVSLQQTYNELYHMYEVDSDLRSYIPDSILIEDTNSGYDFFSSFLRGRGYTIISAGGKSNVLSWLKEHSSEKTLVIADGAAFGSDMDRVTKYKRRNPNIALYLPESFEWLILSSGIIKDNHIDEILSSPERFIESRDFFSWERYFNDLLTTVTKDTYLNYSKSKLNKVYLQKNIGDRIIESIKGIAL